MSKLSNLIAAAGTLLIVGAVCGLAGIWWGMLVLGGFLLASSFAMHQEVSVLTVVGPVSAVRDRVKDAA